MARTVDILESLDAAVWGDDGPNDSTAVGRGVAARAALLAAKEALALGAGEAANELLERAVSLNGPHASASKSRFDVELSLALAEQAFIEGRLVDVGDHARSALHVVDIVLRDQSKSSPSTTADALAAKAHLLVARGLATGADLDEAAPHFERAAALFRAAASPSGEIQVALSYGFALLDAEQSEDAEEVFEQARAMADEADTPTLLGRALGYLGNTARYRGRYARAQAFYEQAKDTLSTLADPTWRSVFAMDAGMCSLCSGDILVAIAHLQEAQTGFDSRGHRKLFRLTTVALDLAQAWRGFEAGDIDDDGGSSNQVRAMVRADQDPTLERNCLLYELGVLALNGGTTTIPPTPARSDQHNIIARRIVDVILAEQSSERAVWTLVPDATSVVSPQGETIVLDRHPLLSRLVLAFVDGHRQTPGAPLSPDALFAHGWPNEKAIPDAIKNRVRVAISTLRRKGLRELIVSGEGGYFFAANVSVRVR